jgi:glutathione S-transferase
MAPHIALHELGIDFERKPVSLGRKENRTPEYLAVNPEGKVPTLLIDGRRLTEVAGILFYLARRQPDAGLLPSGDPEAEAQAVSWMSFLAASEREWAIGRYSIADIHLFRLFWRFRNSLNPAPGEFPNLVAHHDRMMARSAVQRTIAIEAAIGYELPA